jgi:hypothetical protein
MAPQVTGIACIHADADADVNGDADANAVSVVEPASKFPRYEPL